MEIRLLSADDAIAYWGDRYLDEEYMVFHVKTSYTMRSSGSKQWKKASSTFQSRTPRQPSPRTAKPRNGY
jgi:hypothetical protein